MSKTTFRMNVEKQLTDEKIILDNDQQILLTEIDNLFNRKYFFFQTNNKTGVYVYGPPGRGKSMMMDLCFKYYQGSKIRIHFHEFLKSMNKRLTSKSSFASDSIHEVTDEWMADYKLLCFDEFHVHDIADAIIIGRFLERTIKKRHKIILTSNYEPDNLQPDPRFHERFLPTIELIKHSFTIVSLMGNQDYRYLNTTKKQTSNFYHLTDLNYLLNLSKRIDLSIQISEQAISLSNRSFNCLAKGEKVIGFNFKNLCVNTTSYIDYIELTEKWDYLLLTDIDTLSLKDNNAIQRFIWLIDILYDRHITLYTTSSHPLIELIKQQCIHIKDIERTISRLNEMQYR